MQLLTLLGLLLSMTLLRVWAFEYLYGHTEKNVNNNFLLLLKKKGVFLVSSLSKYVVVGVLISYMVLKKLFFLIE